jgi:hypothetical protein
MLILPDNDVTGAVAILRQVLESPEWDEFSAALELTFLTFEELGLSRDAPDRAIWLACQRMSAVLLTANRSGGEHSLERTIDELRDATSLPVITLADPKRILRDGEYATNAAVRLLDYLTQIDSLRGSGRLFVP